MTRAEQLVQQVLNAARASIVVESTSAIQGPPPSPNTPAPPDTRTMQATLVQQAGVINAQGATIQQQQATIAAFPQLLTDAIVLNNTQFVMPALQAMLATVNTSLTNLTTVVGTKALASDVTALVATVGTKATAADLSTLTTTVNTKAADLASLATVVAGKALASDLSTLQGTVTANTAAIATKAASADLAALTTAVGNKALASDLTALQATVTTNTTAIATKATTASVTALSTVVDGKASIASVTAAATTAAQGVTDAATQKTRVDGLISTTVPQLQADTALRLLRTGDTSTGSQMQPVAIAGAAAPRLDQTYGGLNAPIRFATSVGTTAVAMSPGPLTDPTPQGRKAKPYLVVLTMRTAPTIGATITVGTTSGGAEVFTKTYLLAALPGLNAVLAPMQPIFIELPAGTTLYAKATAGAWDVEVLSYYKA